MYKKIILLFLLLIVLVSVGCLEEEGSITPILNDGNYSGKILSAEYIRGGYGQWTQGAISVSIDKDNTIYVISYQKSYNLSSDLFLAAKKGMYLDFEVKDNDVVKWSLRSRNE